MAYKDHKVLCEHLYALNFTRKISVSNFREPNFELVSEILHCAAKITDSNSEFSKDTDTEAQRVLLIRSYTAFFIEHLGIQLNPKNLYTAQGEAVPELLKVTTPLYKASQNAGTLDFCNQELENATPNSFEQNKELSKLRQSASDVIQSAAALHQQLNGEVEARLCREDALARDLDLSNLENVVGGSLTVLTQQVQDLKENAQKLLQQEKEIEEKIAKKKILLDRNRSRLATLKKIKPNWESEFEFYEIELSALWEEYIKKHMSLASMEEQLNNLQVGQTDTSHFIMRNSKTSVVNALHSDSAEDDNKSEAAIKKSSGASHVFGDMFGSNIDTTDEGLTDSWSSDSSDTLERESVNNNSQKLIDSEPQGKKLRKKVYKERSSKYDSELSPSPRRSSNRPSSARVPWQRQLKPANPTAQEQRNTEDQCFTDDGF